MGLEEKSMNMKQTSGYMTAAPNLLALPDDVLLMIMSYLGPFDLLNVAQLSERLGELSHDRTLWTVVDTRPNRLTLPELTTIVEQLQPTTRMLAVRGFATVQKEKVSISPSLLRKISSRCPALDTLILEEQYAEIKKSRKHHSRKQFQLKVFPKTLTTLSLKGCDFQIKTYQESFFHDINVHMPQLKVLILSGCKWVFPHDFIPIGKCNTLEELRLDSCHKLGECVAYTSLAARFGFRALKILDLRDTNMGDSDVTCFNRTSSLTHLYLERPSNPRNHMNIMSGCYNSRYGWTEYIFPEASPIIVINRLGQTVDHRVDSPPVEDEELVEDEEPVEEEEEEEEAAAPQQPPPPPTPPESANEAAPGPSSTCMEIVPKGYQFHSVFDGRTTTMWPLTRSVSTLCMTSPGPSSAPEKSQKRKSECVSSSSKRVKWEDQNGHSEEELAEAVNGTGNQDDNSGPSSINVKVEMKSDNSSDSSSDDDDSIVYMLCGKKYVRKLPKNHHRCRTRRESSSDDTTGPEPIISDLCVMSLTEDLAALNNNGHMGRRMASSSNLWYVRLMYPEVSGERPNLHTLVLRNFSRVTDQSLRLLTDHSSLRYLDVSGTSVTERAVLDFKLNRPEVEVVSDFDVPF